MCSTCFFSAGVISRIIDLDGTKDIEIAPKYIMKIKKTHKTMMILAKTVNHEPFIKLVNMRSKLDSCVGILR